MSNSTCLLTFTYINEITTKLQFCFEHGSNVILELLEFIFPLSLMCRIIGNNHIVVNKRDKSYEFINTPSGLFNFIFRILGLTAISGLGLFLISTTNNNRVLSLRLFHFLTNSLFLYIDVIFDYRLSEKSQKVWEKYVELERYFEMKKIILNLEKYSETRKILVVIFFAMLVYWSVYSFLLLPTMLAKTMSISLTISQYAQIITLIYYMNTFQVLTNFFKITDDYLKSNMKNPIKLKKSIECVARIHQVLCELKIEANTVVSIRLLYMQVLYYLASAFYAYNLLCYFLHEKCNSPWITASGFIWTLTFFILIVETSKKLNKTAFEIKKTLFEIATTSMDAVVIKETNAFLLQLSHEDPLIIIARTFRIDYELVFKLFGESVTALSLLLQSNFNGNYEDHD